MTRIRLLGNDSFTISLHREMTIAGLIRDVAARKHVDGDSIACYQHGQLLLPFVKIQRLQEVEICFDNELYSKLRLNLAFKSDGDPSPSCPSGRLFSIRMAGYNTCGITCTVNGAQTKMIVDTGASMSILSASFVLATDLYQRIDYGNKWQLPFATAGGAFTWSLGILHEVPIVVGTTETKQRFVILDSGCENGLLGIDWLLANSAVIDVLNDCMYVGNQKIEFQDV
jgi:hypothetical protein